MNKQMTILAMITLVATSFATISCSQNSKKGGSNSSKSGSYSSPMAQSQHDRQKNFNNNLANPNSNQSEKSALQQSASQSQHDKQIYANEQK